MPKPTLVDMTAYNLYPDTNEDKEVFVQAAGHQTKAMEIPRHILLCWLKSSSPDVRRTRRWGVPDHIT